VQIKSLELLLFKPPLVGLRVTCSRGTYIRSLANDIGAALGCGASLQELRRIASGSFRLSTAATLESLEERKAHGSLDVVCVTPFDALGYLPDIPLTESGYGKLLHGRPPDWGETLLSAPPTLEQLQLVRLSLNGALVAVAQSVSAPDGNLQLILKRVFV
jgi:tRNA pseudouridine55 synthase